MVEWRVRGAVCLVENVVREWTRLRQIVGLLMIVVRSRARKGGIDGHCRFSSAVGLAFGRLGGNGRGACGLLTRRTLPPAAPAPSSCRSLGGPCAGRCARCTCRHRDQACQLTSYFSRCYHELVANSMVATDLTHKSLFCSSPLAAVFTSPSTSTTESLLAASLAAHIYRCLRGPENEVAESRRVSDEGY